MKFVQKPSKIWPPSHPCEIWWHCHYPHPLKCPIWMTPNTFVTESSNYTEVSLSVLPIPRWCWYYIENPCSLVKYLLHFFCFSLLKSHQWWRVGWSERHLSWWSWKRRWTSWRRRSGNSSACCATFSTNCSTRWTQERLTRCQFHQHFRPSFFVCKCSVQLFST